MAKAKSTEQAEHILQDRAIYHSGPLRSDTQFHAWLIWNKKDEINILTDDGKFVIGSPVADLIKVTGMTSYLTFHFADRKMKFQLMPSLRTIKVHQDMMNDSGAIGNLYKENKMEKLSNITLWVSMLRDRGVLVRYWPFRILFPVVFFGSIAIMALLAFVLSGTFIMFL
jgi:hypothetical protein